jgi:2-polyprenyl-3-methyl-5-hydroxy-6-metoxy-1,4-benzoquinol methylase
VLEVGPGNGVISRWLRTQKQCKTIGVEVVVAASELARDAFEQIIIGSIETPTIVSEVSTYAPFDAIVFADVLEHLIDPWQVLRNMRPLLAPNGRVLLSVPNVAHWIARLNLLLGRFNYTDGYLMDRTHLRWFTRSSAKQMAIDCGYHIAAEGTVFKPHIFRFWPTMLGFQTVLNLAVH